jgi:hypothetical protein
MATPKKTPPLKLTGSLAKVLKPIKAPPMTPQDAAMLKILQKKYGKNVYKPKG